MARKIILHSPLSPVALANTLKNALGGEDAAPRAGVCGHGTDQDMMLFVFRPNFKNSFATALTATMEAAGSGTTITGTIGVPASGIVFMWVWNGFLGLFVIAALSAMIAAGDAAQNWPMALFPLGMLGFGWLLWTVGTWSDKADQAAILKFLADTAQARGA
jgi:hypothetical protein